jgi:hypothetical protein
MRQIRLKPLQKIARRRSVGRSGCGLPIDGRAARSLSVVSNQAAGQVSETFIVSRLAPVTRTCPLVAEIFRSIGAITGVDPYTAILDPAYG